jgi:hypothetical protein
MTTHDSNTIIKFADDTRVVGLITDGDETAYRDEVRDLALLCHDKNLCLNVNKTKDLFVDNRRKMGKYTPIHIAVVEQVESFYCLSVHIPMDLKWSAQS